MELWPASPFLVLKRKARAWQVASRKGVVSAICSAVFEFPYVYRNTPQDTTLVSAAAREEVSSYCSSWRASDRVAHRAPRREHFKGSLSAYQRPLYHFTQNYQRPKGGNCHGSQKTFIDISELSSGDCFYKCIVTMKK